MARCGIKTLRREGDLLELTGGMRDSFEIDGGMRDEKPKITLDERTGKPFLYSFSMLDCRVNSFSEEKW